MNWRLVLLLSLLGVAMGFAIVFLLPSSVTTVPWSLIVVLSGYAIAKRCARLRFLNGLLVGLFDRLFSTGVQVVLFHAYAVRHPDNVALMHELAPAMTVRRLLAVTSPVLGLLYGVAIGLVAVVIGVFLKPPAAEV